MKTPRTIHYSQLRYEKVSPYRKGKGRQPRVWFIEYQYKNIWRSIYKDLRLLFWRVLKWLKIEYRKEFLFGLILLFALVPSPKPVRAQVAPVPVQPYLKTIPKLSPVVPVAFSVPDKVEPIVPPPAPVAAPVVVTAPVNSAPSGCGDNFYANYIYMHESGCNTGSTNSIGCFGIGQDCNNIVRNRCGMDYACQNAYFTTYSAKYGGWAGSYAFWLSHHWW